MGFSPLPPHWFPPCAPFPPPHGCRRLYRSCSGIVPAAAVRAILIVVLPAPLPLPRGPRHRHRSSRRTTPAVIKSMIRHRSHPPYITFYPVPHLSPTSTFAQCFPFTVAPRLHTPPVRARAATRGRRRPWPARRLPGRGGAPAAALTPEERAPPAKAAPRVSAPHPWPSPSTAPRTGPGSSTEDTCHNTAPRSPPPTDPQNHPSTQGIRFPSSRTIQTATFSSQPCAISAERVEGVSRSLPFSDLLTLTSCHVFVSVVN